MSVCLAEMLPHVSVNLSDFVAGVPKGLKLYGLVRKASELLQPLQLELHFQSKVCLWKGVLHTCVLYFR